MMFYINELINYIINGILCKLIFLYISPIVAFYFLKNEDPDMNGCIRCRCQFVCRGDWSLSIGAAHGLQTVVGNPESI